MHDKQELLRHYRHNGLLVDELLAAHAKADQLINQALAATNHCSKDEHDFIAKWSTLWQKLSSFDTLNLVREEVSHFLANINSVKKLLKLWSATDNDQVKALLRDRIWLVIDNQARLKPQFYQECFWRTWTHAWRELPDQEFNELIIKPTVTWLRGLSNPAELKILYALSSDQRWLYFIHLRCRELNDQTPWQAWKKQLTAWRRRQSQAKKNKKL